MPREVAVADALRAISAAHLEILNETILRGRTVNEAAATMGLPVGTVKSRVYYALRALCLVLAERSETGVPPVSADQSEPRLTSRNAVHSHDG